MICQKKWVCIQQSKCIQIDSVPSALTRPVVVSEVKINSTRKIKSYETDKQTKKKQKKLCQWHSQDNTINFILEKFLDWSEVNLTKNGTLLKMIYFSGSYNNNNSNEYMNHEAALMC